MRSARCIPGKRPNVAKKTIMGGRIPRASLVARGRYRAGLQPVSFLLTKMQRQTLLPAHFAEKPLVLRWPSLRRPFDVLFLVTSLALAVYVLVPEIWGNGKTKDYPLWFWAGQQVLQGKPLYPSDPNAYFEFIYPPLPAILLALPSAFGKIALYLGLSLLNAAAWWITSQLSNAMAGSGRIPSAWIAALPGFLTITFVFDMFDLGQ